MFWLPFLLPVDFLQWLSLFKMQEKSHETLHFTGGFRNNIFQDHRRLSEQLFRPSRVLESQNKFFEDGFSKELANELGKNLNVTFITTKHHINFKTVSVHPERTDLILKSLKKYPLVTKSL